MEIQVDFLESNVYQKLVIIWFLLSHVGFLTGCKLFILKVIPIYRYTFCKITTCIQLYFSIAKGLATCLLGGVISAQKVLF